MAVFRHSDQNESKNADAPVFRETAGRPAAFVFFIRVSFASDLWQNTSQGTAEEDPRFFSTIYTSGCHFFHRATGMQHSAASGTASGAGKSAVPGR